MGLNEETKIINQINISGKIQIPKEILKYLGWRYQDDIEIFLTEGGLFLRKIDYPSDYLK